MIRSCFVRLKDNRLFCFYFRAGKGILYRIYENRKWGGENRLIENGRENFTVNIGNGGGIYVVCQDAMGDIILCGGNPGAQSEWTRKVVLKNQSSRIRVVQMNTIVTDGGICFVYNVPHAENYIVRQMMDENGNWSPAAHIDKFVPLSDSLFQAHRVSGDHYILYYINKSNEYNIGYREVTSKMHGRFNSFHTTGYIISDSSFLTTNEDIHVLYIIKGMFSSQLIYRRKETIAFGNPIVLAEAQKVENCLLFFSGGRLYATYIINSQLFYCVSDDGGESFTRPVRYKNKFCLEPVRAVYISEIDQSVDEFFCRQIYVDSMNLWDAQLLPDMCESFYPDPVIRQAEQNQAQTATVTAQSTAARAEKPVQVAKQEPVKRASPQYNARVFEDESVYNDFIQAGHSWAQQAEAEYMSADADTDELGEELIKIKNKLAMSEGIIADKDRQILELTGIMKHRSEEIAGIEFERRNQYRELLHEHERTLARLSELEGKYERVLLEYGRLTVKNEEPASADEAVEDTPPDN